MHAAFGEPAGGRRQRLFRVNWKLKALVHNLRALPNAWRKRREGQPPELPRSYLEYVNLQVGTDNDEYLRTPHYLREAEGQRRYIRKIAPTLPREGLIIDCAAGDGLTLAELRNFGFPHLAGVEMSPYRAARARRLGLEILEMDMHDLSRIESGSVAALLSSHTLEHALDPEKAVREFHRILKPGGDLHVVLPYPDPGHWNDHMHVGKRILGLDRVFGERNVIRFFTDRGFRLRGCDFDTFREPEIQIAFSKAPSP